jgi:uncharacterized protein (DUF58 family)
MEKRELNVNFADRISDFESLMNKMNLKWIIYKILFRGKGLEFDGYRVYSPDDDAKAIDWMASSRGQEILVKKYIEERDLKIVFLIDVGDGMVFGSSEKLKCEYAAEIAASLSHLVAISGDAIGFSLFNNEKSDVVSPKGGIRQFNIFSAELTNCDNYGGRPKELGEFLDFLVGHLNSSVNAVFLISDFIHLGKNFERSFEYFSNKFEIIPIIVRDKLDEFLPKINSEFVIENPATGQQMVINSALARKNYEKKVKQDKETLLRGFEDVGVEYLDLKTDESFAGPLVEFLNQRAKRRKVVMPQY